MADPRQRAPFPHASSSADLTNPEVISPTRTFHNSPWQQQQHPNAHGQENGGPVNGLWKHDDYPAGPSSPGGGHHHQDHKSNGYLHPAGPIYSLDTPPPGSRRTLTPSEPRSRSPSPNPFKLPPLQFPGLSTLRFVGLCTLWYASSALSSNTGKVILNNFRYPVTLTIVQFFFVAGYCILCSRPELGWTGRLRQPSLAILRGTLPMAAFQVGGHIFSSLAISRVPVSTVHTIKALSPLITVFAYALLFRVSYSPATYLSLLPLTAGVMLACSFEMKISNIFGLICAFGSTIIFVSQNIFFKKIMPTNADSATGLAGAPKLDKINLLYFSSSMAFLLMIPVWLYNDAGRLLNDWPIPRNGPSLPFYLFINGTVHFAQNLLAFAILSSTSPVTYSIASLVKRIAVICLAIIWFSQNVHFIQAIGIALTAIGLWMYNNAKRDVEKGERKMRQAESGHSLPSHKSAMEEKSSPLFGFLGLSSQPPYPVHVSPKPVYPAGFKHGSTSSALRSGYFPLAPQSAPGNRTTPVKTAYPSPPTSAEPSPPQEESPALPSNAHIPSNRNRGPSAEFRGDRDQYRPSSVGSHTPKIDEKEGIPHTQNRQQPMVRAS